jgi:phosphopantetheinyl transferase
MDCQRLTVHAVNSIHQMGPVFYASLRYRSCAAETLKRCETDGARDKRRLVSDLWEHFVAMEIPVWKRCQSSGRANFPIRVVSGLLGRPHLMLGEYQGPAISFSKGGGKVWAALSGDESEIGIDVAETDEFNKEYPFQRVFHPQEIEHAMRLAGGYLEKASALLWSIKEAVVKALGCAFHLVDPLQIIIHPSVAGVAEEDGGHAFPVGLSGKALERFPIDAGWPLWVISFPQRKMWLSIALLKRRPTGHA